MAGDLEEIRVLPLKEDRRNMRLARGDQLGGEGFPFIIECGRERPVGGRDAARRKDDDAAAILEVLDRSRARFNIGLHRLFGSGEIDR